MNLEESDFFGDNDDVAASALGAHHPLAVLPESVARAIAKQMMSRISSKVCQADTAPMRPDDATAPAPEEIDAFCDALIARDNGAARRIFQTLDTQGRTLETLCLRLIAPAARRLGERWTDDRAPAQIHVERTRVPPDGMRFSAHAMGADQVVTVTPRGVRYAHRYPNWMTWTVTIGTLGIAAAVAWKRIQFGSVEEYITAERIESVEVDERGDQATLVISSAGDRLELLTDRDSAAAAAQLLASG